MESMLNVLQLLALERKAVLVIGQGASNGLVSPLVCFLSIRPLAKPAYCVLWRVAAGLRRQSSLSVLPVNHRANTAALLLLTFARLSYLEPAVKLTCRGGTQGIFS